jgi:uncharacterized protein (TIGR00730 family)
MQIRPAVTSDIDALHKVRTSVKENVLSDPGFITPAMYADFLTQRGRGWLCESKGEVCGFAIVDLKQNNVWALFVLPGQEGKGIGQLLQKIMLDSYFEDTDEPIWLSTQKGSRAERFYQTSGWQEAGTTQSGEARFEMSRNLWKAQGRGSAELKSVTVFCGASSGNLPEFGQQAYALGKMLALRNTTLVYGGAKIGLMGKVADGAIDNRGRVIGVLPGFLKTKEVAHSGLTQLILVDTMHERKLKMHELSEGIIALPGGYGTLEELFEMLTWGQLGLHRKPIGILNIHGFYNELIAMVRKMVQSGFLKEINESMLLISDNAESLLEMMKRYQAPLVETWISRDST